MTIKITNGGITRKIESSEYGIWFSRGYRKEEPIKEEKEELKTEPIVTEPEHVADDDTIIVKPKKKK